MRKFFAIATFIMGLGLGLSPALAFDAIYNNVPQAEKIGEGRLTYLFWDVYDAALFAPQGQWERDKPFALSLSYLMDLKGKKIADRTIEEIRKQGFDDELKLADWHAQMKRIFPNVSDGVSLIGVYTESGETIFYMDDINIGVIEDPEFGPYFFDIWLGEQTTAPDLRKKLLGEL